MSSKEQHEIAIGNQLLNWLKCDSQFIRHGNDDGEPDLIYALGGRKVGIEIATAYYLDHQAKVEWQLVRGELKSGPRGTKIGVPMNPHKVIIARVQQEIDDKCKKTYSGVDAVWLSIEQHAPLADVRETEELVASITIPPHKFERIYLVFHAPMSDGGGFRGFLLSGKPTIS